MHLDLLKTKWSLCFIIFQSLPTQILRIFLHLFIHHFVVHSSDVNIGLKVTVEVIVMSIHLDRNRKPDQVKWVNEWEVQMIHIFGLLIWFSKSLCGFSFPHIYSYFSWYMLDFTFFLQNFLKQILNFFIQEDSRTKALRILLIVCSWMLL